jgi:hypothetical protein
MPEDNYREILATPAEPILNECRYCGDAFQGEGDDCGGCRLGDDQVAAYLEASTAAGPARAQVQIALSAPDAQALLDLLQTTDTFPDVVDELRAALGGVAEDQDTERGER